MIIIAFSRIYYHELSEGHRFPKLKYELIPEQLLHEGTISRDNLFVPNKCDKMDILRTHDVAYYEKLVKHQLKHEGV